MIFFGSALGFITLIGAVAISQAVNAPSLFEKWFLSLWFCGLGWVWYSYLKMPIEIKISSENSIEFRSVLKPVRLSPQEIKSIKAMPLSPGFINIRHTKGTVRLINQMDGFYDFVSTLKSLNPSIQVKGC